MTKEEHDLVWDNGYKAGYYLGNKDKDKIIQALEALKKYDIVCTWNSPEIPTGLFIHSRDLDNLIKEVEK